MKRTYYQFPLILEIDKYGALLLTLENKKFIKRNYQYYSNKLRCISEKDITKIIKRMIKEGFKLESLDRFTYDIDLDNNYLKRGAMIYYDKESLKEIDYPAFTVFCGDF